MRAGPLNERIRQAAGTRQTRGQVYVRLIDISTRDGDGGGGPGSMPVGDGAATSGSVSACSGRTKTACPSGRWTAA
ncbi:hypothetical protein B0G38_003388 [Arthrobacter sp. VKM Ac-2550]|nr:hypothetical protein [Arthrobacter sp. VKM Ac-2550]